MILDQIKLAYPKFQSHLDKKELRESLGLTGPGPWGVMLCGYLLQALRRDPDAIRQAAYVAQAGDETFI